MTDAPNANDTPQDCKGGGEHDFSKEIPTIVDGNVVGTDYVCVFCGLTVEELVRREWMEAQAAKQHPQGDGGNARSVRKPDTAAG